MTAQLLKSASDEMSSQTLNLKSISAHCIFLLTKTRCSLASPKIFWRYFEIGMNILSNPILD